MRNKALQRNVPGESPSNSAVYAIVVTHNGSAWIEACLQSLKDSIYPVEIVVIDNASTDSTPLIISRFANVTFLQQDQNLGFGRANNIGIGVALEAGADLVFLLNQDARVHPETIGELVRCSIQHASFGILSPFHLNGDGTALDGRFARYLRRTDASFFSDLYLGRLSQVYPIGFVNAAGWLLTRQCLKQVGGFDPLFFMYSEDNDFCDRAAFHGYHIGVVPSAIICHDRGPNRRVGGSVTTAVDLRVNRFFSRMLNTLKHPSGWFAARLLRVGVGYVRISLDLIVDGDYAGLGALLLAMTRILRWLPKVWKHRRIGQSTGLHWID